MSIYFMHSTTQIIWLTCIIMCLPLKVLHRTLLSNIKFNIPVCLSWMYIQPVRLVLLQTRPCHKFFFSFLNNLSQNNPIHYFLNLSEFNRWPLATHIVKASIFFLFCKPCFDFMMAKQLLFFIFQIII